MAERKTYSEYMRIHLLKYKKLVYDFYGAICNCCGEAEQKFLSIDHVDNDGYKDKNVNGKKITGMNLYKKIFKENFPKKYQILCMNCNHGKRMNHGVCPHKEILP